MKIVALLAFGLFTAAALSSCTQGNTTNNANKVETTVETPKLEARDSKVVFPTEGLRVAWVNMDSLLKGYDYYFAMQREMEALSASAEKELGAKAAQLQKRDEKLRVDMEKGLVTRSEAQQQAQELAQDQTRYLQLQEAKRRQLEEEEQVRLRRVQESIDNFIRKYNQEHGFHYILSLGLLYADPALSVTADVLRGLNAEYAAQHASETGAKK